MFSLLSSINIIENIFEPYMKISLKKIKNTSQTHYYSKYKKLTSCIIILNSRLKLQLKCFTQKTSISFPQ